MSSSGHTKDADPGAQQGISLIRGTDGFSGVFDPTAQVEASVAWHGEIHNLPALARQLGLPATASAVAVVLAAWAHWGVDCLPRLEGVFALALQSAQELLLYRDPSGLRNLFHAPAPAGRTAFASRLDALWPLPGVRPRHRPNSLHEYLRLLDIAAPNTWYEGVVAVEPGQALRVTAHGTQTQRWPLPEAPQRRRAAAPGELEAAVEQLERRLQASVDRLLADAQRPACFLSGGIDSALLCALAARVRGDLTAVTVGFEGSAFDEAPVAQRIAAHLGLRHEVLRFSRADYLGALERHARGAEQPMADPAALATLLAFEHCRARFDVVIDGTGADEAVGLMPPRHVRLAVGVASRLPRGLRLGIGAVLRSLPASAPYSPIVDFDHPADTLARWGGFTRQEIERLCVVRAGPVSFAHTQFHRTYHRHPRSAHFQRYSALLNAMPCERLTQAMLLSGMDPGFPFCDAPIDTYLRGLPIDLRWRPGEPKRILRALLARHLPSPLWDQPKHGFDFPLHDFLAGDDFAVVRHRLWASSWPERIGLDAREVQRWGQAFIDGERRLGFRVWALAVLGAWLDGHAGSAGVPA